MTLETLKTSELLPEQAHENDTAESSENYKDTEVKKSPETSENSQIPDMPNRNSPSNPQSSPQAAPDESQEQAIAMALENKVLVITGGPGTGKTFTLNHILRRVDHERHEVALAAPTGKAAKRMSELCLRPAQTIHRLLEYRPTHQGEWGFFRNEGNPLPHKMVVIDESSMIDIRLMRSLLVALKDDAQLILIGDKDQLPSVGPGNVFRDIIESKRIPVAELTNIHRQSEHSWISVNARKLNRGEMIEIDPNADDFFVEFQEEKTMARDFIVDLITEKIPAMGFDPFQTVQLLCPMKKGDLGVFTFNEILQERLNPLTGQKTMGRFREGDKVIHIRNNYEIGVMNGETGQIVEILDYHQANQDDLVLYRLSLNEVIEDWWNGSASKKDLKAAKVDFGDRTVAYVPWDMDDLHLAYAMTIHKSQGSEWPCVIVPVHSTHHHMLSRNLIYTGITRGKSAVFVVGNHKGLARAVQNNAPQLRYTTLKEHLTGVFGSA